MPPCLFLASCVQSCNYLYREYIRIFLHIEATHHPSWDHGLRLDFVAHLPGTGKCLDWSWWRCQTESAHWLSRAPHREQEKLKQLWPRSNLPIQHLSSVLPRFAFTVWGIKVSLRKGFRSLLGLDIWLVKESWIWICSQALTTSTGVLPVAENQFLQLMQVRKYASYALAYSDCLAS